jgi:hypothetical protein
MTTLVPPDDPKGWGERVSFGAQEDHSFYPGPGMLSADSDTTRHEMKMGRVWLLKFTTS